MREPTKEPDTEDLTREFEDLTIPHRKLRPLKPATSSMRRHGPYRGPSSTPSWRSSPRRLNRPWPTS